ncbi:MAG TPA: hypothetical protein VGP76_21395 [Planctomycetaceae bacterium]|jgi:hypothetical protein|nr:hypothetical protein [Planctomycetaceae bacterium]
MQHNDVLNGVLILLRRSLLQYAAEAWPWTGSGSGEPQAAIDRLIAAQAERVRKLAELLDSRRWTIDFGAFPDFTDLHYLSLVFVLPHIAENERQIVRELELALPACAGDSQATALVAAILSEESQALVELTRLAGPRPSTTQSAA